MSSSKNVLRLDKNSIYNNCSYAQLSGIYYNCDGFSNATNKKYDLGTYNPDKYLLGNITKPNKKTFIDYNKNNKLDKIENNTKINININNTHDISDIIIPTIEADVKPITEILNKTNNTTSKNIIINSKEFKESHNNEKIINNEKKYNVNGKLSVNLCSKAFENKEKNNDNVIYLNGWVLLNKFNKPYAHNFGDDINFSFLTEITGKIHKLYNNELITNYLMIGSIFIDKYINKFTEVWGSGMLKSLILYKKPNKVYAVRGPKTRDICLKSNIECPEIYGDPVLLMPYYYYPYVMKKYKLGIIPHHSHINLEILNKFNDNKNIKIINFTKYNDWRDIIKEIIECEFIVSESLHGLIISESYKIPNIWVSIKNNIGLNFKYEDFFLSINKPIYNSYLITESTTYDDLLKLRDNYDSTYKIDLLQLVDVCPIKLKNLNLNNHIKPYTGKVLLCCIGKMENNYIREFVEHYKSIGFDNICLYDNNDINGEHFEDVINDYIDSEFVILKNWRGKKQALIPSYTDCYNTYKNEYDWIAYFDIDEFLNLDCNNIKKFLSHDKFNDRGINCIRVCWKQFTDSDIIKANGDYSINKFKDYILLENDKNCTLTKIIIKTLLDTVNFDSAHGIIYNKNNHIICVNTNGDLCTNSIIIDKPTWKNACLHHYRFKTIEEFVLNKMVRLWPTNYLNSGKNALNLNMFFKFNNFSLAKLDYANYLLDKYNIDRNE